jgi:hypothetical protein
LLKAWGGEATLPRVTLGSVLKQRRKEEKRARHKRKKNSRRGDDHSSVTSNEGEHAAGEENSDGGDSGDGTTRRDGRGRARLKPRESEARTASREVRGVSAEGSVGGGSLSVPQRFGASATLFSAESLTHRPFYFADGPTIIDANVARQPQFLAPAPLPWESHRAVAGPEDNSDDAATSQKKTKSKRSKKRGASAAEPTAVDEAPRDRSPRPPPGAFGEPVDRDEGGPRQRAAAPATDRRLDLEPDYANSWSVPPGHYDTDEEL